MSGPALVTLKLPRLYPKQREAVFCPQRYSNIEASTKAGKAQPLHSLVYTPIGPVPMGSIRVGDDVLTPDGGASRVVGVYPQGLRPVYRVTFSDGQQVECDKDHLWEIGRFGTKYAVLSTSNMLTWDAKRLSRAWVPGIQPVAFQDSPVLLDPYLIGLLIGDGGLTTEIVRFSSNDPELIESLQALIPAGHRAVHTTNHDWNITAGSGAAALREKGMHLRGMLTKLGLTGQASDQKRIPRCYLYNSIEKRKSILQGILDTDGFVDKHGQPAIEQTSELLAKDIKELVESLGGSVLTNKREINGYKKDGVFIQCKPVYRQVIKFPDARWCFRLKRKVEKVKAKKKTGHRFFRSIEYVGEMPTQCIEIDHPRHLYLTDGLIPTHNTVGCMVWIVHNAWTTGKEGRNYWWIAPTFPVAKIAYRRIRRMLNRADPSKTIWKSNESELWIELVSGGRIWFKGSDSPDNLYGEDVFAAVIDEASRCKEEAFYAVRSTLTATRGPVRIIGNVRGRKNWAFKLARAAQAGAPDSAYFKLTAYDAVEGGVLKIEEIEDAKRVLPEHIFKELYLAEPSDDGGNPFGLSAIARCVQAGLADGPVHCWGVDLAKSHDWTVALALNEQGKTTELDRWQGDWKGTRLKLTAKLGQAPAAVDSTGVGDPIVEDLQAVLPNIEGFKFSSTSKQQLMVGLASAIQTGAIGITDGWLRNELEAFEYQYSASGVKYSAPSGMHDDGVMALALAWSKFSSVARAPKLSIAWIGDGDNDDN